MDKIINSLFNKIVYGIGTLRAFFWGLFLKQIGSRVDIMAGVIIMSPQNVSIGHDVLLNKDTKIGGQNGVKIGNYVMLSYNVNLVSENHAYQHPELPIKKQGYFGGPIEIESDVWVGANAVILPNVKIGRGAIVAANAVVTKDVEEFAIVGGVPAKVIGVRENKELEYKLGRARLFQ